VTVRTRTVLFTDLVGSTALLEALGERAAHRLQGAHLDALREQTEHHRGRVVKTLGDGVMAVFCAARDAIGAAGAMQRATAEARERRGPRALGLRVGISSGDVRVEHEDCIGAPVVEASRLCARASGGQILLAESTRLLAGPEAPLRPLGDLALKGLTEPTRTWEPRVLLADDAVLVREGVARVLEERGLDVVAQVGDADELLRLTADLRPDLAIVDVRMPPSHQAEGLEAAERIVAAHPKTGVLLLSQELEPRYADRLVAVRSAGVGYLLKERVADVRQFADAARRVAAGGRAFDELLMRPEEETT
jgi:class 3 adenylate cyclase